MGILPAQAIRSLCIDGWRVPPEGAELDLIRASSGNSYYTSEVRKLIDPFVERGEFEGRTFGLGPCTYDLRLKYILGDDNDLHEWFILPPGGFVLASSIERVAFPYYVCGTILDKSSHAREGVSAFNTHFDPGFHGYPTIELVNLGRKPMELRAGLPICQMKFEKLEFPTNIPYKGKYSNQADRPVRAIASKGAWGAQLSSETKAGIS